MIIEAVIAVLILFGFVFASIAKQAQDRQAFEQKPSLYETANLLTKIAREDEQIRGFVLDNDEPRTKDLLGTKIMSINLNVNLGVKICDISENCLSNLPFEGKDIYSSDTVISSGQESKRLKVFVWKK